MSFEPMREDPTTSRRRPTALALAVYASCLMLSLAACESEVPPEQELCGDGQVDEGEQCDGADHQGKTCTTLNAAFSGGSLACDPISCMFDTRECVVAVPSRCGDGMIEGNEECEPGVNDEGQTCGSVGVVGDPGSETNIISCDNTTCRWDTGNCYGARTVCGDGRIEGNEQCEGEDFGGLACQHLNSGAFAYFSGGTLSCDRCKLSANCWGPEGEYCGNGIREGNETCDGEDVGGATCLDVGRLLGRVKCEPGCGFGALDYSECTGGCSGSRFGLTCS